MTERRNCGTVCVVLIPVDDGLIVVRRGDKNNDGYGKLALPGGFQEGIISEPVRVTACREVEEETGLLIFPDDLKIVNVETDEYHHNLIFFEHTPLSNWEYAIHHMIKYPTDEILEVTLINEPIETAYPFHTEEIRKFFVRKRLDSDIKDVVKNMKEAANVAE